MAADPQHSNAGAVAYEHTHSACCQLGDRKDPGTGGVYSLSSMADLFSAWLSMSLENHSLNSSWESNNVGMMKCSRAHS